MNENALLIVGGILCFTGIALMFVEPMISFLLFGLSLLAINIE